MAISELCYLLEVVPVNEAHVFQIHRHSFDEDVWF